jgi:hypothetical protein
MMTAPVASERGQVRHLRIWAIALAAGIAAGLLSWGGGELAQGAFKPRLHKVTLLDGSTMMLPSAVSTNVAEFKNATLAFAILGCILGLAMGFAGGIAGGNFARGVVVGLGAQAAGGLVGTLASLALLQLFYRSYVRDTNDLLSPILIHGGIWAAIGAVAALAFGLGMGCAPRRLLVAALDACVGAFLAAILFQLLGASQFPESGSADPVANSPFVRLVAMLLVTCLVALGAARGALSRAPLSPSPAPSH